MTFGLAKTTRDQLLSKLKRTHFSLNFKEATNNNQTCVLTILVSYYNEQSQLVVGEHLASLSLLGVNASSVLHAIKNEFENLELPWKNIMSILVGSCNIMRGSKNGFETKIQENLASHLLDIDGDTCHHVHNIAKCFTKPFKKFWKVYLVMFTLIFSTAVTLVKCSLVFAMSYP